MRSHDSDMLIKSQRCFLADLDSTESFSVILPDPISNGPQIQGIIKYVIVLSDLAYHIEHIKSLLWYTLSFIIHFNIIIYSTLYHIAKHNNGAYEKQHTYIFYVK